MASITGVTGLSVRTEINNELMAYDECFAMDLQYYYQRNIKQIATFESTEGWVNNGWTGGAGTVANDTTNYKVGSQGIVFTSSAIFGGGHLVSNLNLAVFNDNSASATTDYICFAIYITTANKNNLHNDGLRLKFSCDPYLTNTNGYKYVISKASLTADAWTFFSVAKSAFSSYGTPSWATITGIEFGLENTPGGSVAYTVDCMQLIRKDPSSAIPNPFQRQINGTWTRDFIINSGTWFVGLENNSQGIAEIICRNINSLSASNNLQHTKGLTNFNIQMIVTSKNAQYATGPVWYIDANNFIQVYVDSNLLKMDLRQGGVNTQLTTALTVVVGDRVLFDFRKNGSSISVIAYKNGDKNTPYSLVSETTINTSTLGYVSARNTSTIYYNLNSLGFSLLPMDVPNANTLQGKTPGNSSGQIAVNNSTVCTGLVAEKMDGVRIRAYRSGVQSLGGAGRVEFNAETLDPKNKFASYVATPGVGTYLVHAHLLATSGQAFQIRKNTTSVGQSLCCQSGADYVVNITTLVALTDPADTIDVYALGAVNIIGGEDDCWIDIVQIA
jgi:hypothetical protein